MASRCWLGGWGVSGGGSLGEGRGGEGYLENTSPRKALLLEMQGGLKVDCAEA